MFLQENEKYILMAICQLIILLSTKVSALPLVNTVEHAHIWE